MQARAIERLRDDQALFLASLMSLADFFAESLIGTIWSSSPWMTSVGTSIFCESSVQSVLRQSIIQATTRSDGHSSGSRQRGPARISKERAENFYGSLFCLQSRNRIGPPITLSQIFPTNILRWTRVGDSFRVVAGFSHVADASGSRRFAELCSATVDHLMVLRRKRVRSSKHHRRS
jgi:hypothetical protein